MVERAGAQSRHFEGWVALAIGLHALGALSTWKAAERLRQTPRDLFSTSLDVGVVDEEVPVAPPPPAPAPEGPSPMLTPAPAPPTQATKPRPAEPPSAEAPVPEPLTNRAQRAVSAAADAVAEAAKALTRDDDDPGAVAIASGNSDTPTSGYVAGAGLGTTSTWNPRAGLHGKSGGVGKDTRPDAELGPDRSRRASVIGVLTDACAFPEEADLAGVDHAVAVIVVKVTPKGTAASVTVVSDPGYGFGEAARRCALTTRYITALDRSGSPIASETGPINVRFTR